MHFLYILPMLAMFITASADDFQPEKTNPVKTETISLMNAENFLIFPVFAYNLKAPLMEEMVHSLQMIGNVYPGNDHLLTEEQLEEKYKTGTPILNIVGLPIIEKTNSSDAPEDPFEEEEDYSSITYKRLPVIELSLRMLTGPKIIIGNDHIMPGIIWEKQKFIGEIADQEALTNKAVKTLNGILDNFKRDYQKANPSRNEKKKPQFFIFG
jgi:hypothetical protein